MKSGFLAWAAAAVLSAHAQTEDAEWDINPGGTGTSLRGWSTGYWPIGLECDGTPPVFHLVFFPPKGMGPWAVDSDGAIRIPPGSPREAKWQGLQAALERDEVESLAESAGVVDIEILAPDGEVFRYRSRESATIAPAVGKFLEYCAHHVERTDRQFEIEGIEVELQVEVSEMDLDEIRALAVQFGIEDVQRIFVGHYGLPVSRLVALVESRALRQGETITQGQLTLRQKYWKPWEAGDPDPEIDLRSRGLWEASPEDLYRLDRYIVRDGHWSIEVRFGEGVPYDDTVRIIRAIREGSLVDVREPPPWNLPLLGRLYYELKEGDPYTRPHIKRDEKAPSGESGRYEISLPENGGGTRLQLRIVGETVEVLGVSIWVI